MIIFKSSDMAIFVEYRNIYSSCKVFTCDDPVWLFPARFKSVSLLFSGKSAAYSGGYTCSSGGYFQAWYAHACLFCLWCKLIFLYLQLTGTPFLFVGAVGRDRG